jgi:nucleoside-diphosphate-sugar epimerase
MTHLVTGGSGFLGNLIACRLLERGQRVRILDVWEDPSRPRDIEYLHCDIRDRDGVARAMRGVEVVHHNVALVPLAKAGPLFWDVNVTGSRIAAEEAARAGVRCFVHMSSSATYGIPPRCPITNQTPQRPIEDYGRAKLAGERVVQEVAAHTGMPVIVVRPRTILGISRLGIFQILFDWIREGRRVYVMGSGNNRFQFIHAHDLMDAYTLVLDAGRPGAYNVGAARFGTLREALENLIRHAGTASRVKSLPVWPAMAALRALDWLRLSPLAPWHYLTYHEEFHFDVQPLLDLGWKPRYSNDEMFRESYDWFCANYDRLAAEKAGALHRRPVREGILWLIRRLS